MTAHPSTPHRRGEEKSRRRHGLYLPRDGRDHPWCKQPRHHLPSLDGPVFGQHKCEVVAELLADRFTQVRQHPVQRLVGRASRQRPGCGGGRWAAVAGLAPRGGRRRTAARDPRVAALSRPASAARQSPVAGCPRRRAAGSGHQCRRSGRWMAAGGEGEGTVSPTLVWREPVQGP